MVIEPNVEKEIKTGRNKRKLSFKQSDLINYDFNKVRVQFNQLKAHSGRNPPPHLITEIQ